VDGLEKYNILTDITILYHDQSAIECMLTYKYNVSPKDSTQVALSCYRLAELAIWARLLKT
jgi:hypothetical protein